MYLLFYRGDKIVRKQTHIIWQGDQEETKLWLDLFEIVEAFETFEKKKY
jgi:hypothetical protein